MSKFTLEMELEDTEHCCGCTNIKLSFDREFYCKSIDDFIIYADTIRHPNCPLKPASTTQPEHKCETCKNQVLESVLCKSCAVFWHDFWESKE